MRGLRGDEIRKSNVFELTLREAIDAVNAFDSGLPSEFQQLEQRVKDAAKRSEIIGGKMPVVVNGTWWVYDVEREIYVDTGEPCSGTPGPQGEPGLPGTGLMIRGYADSLTALTEAVTDPQTGDCYGVGTAAPYDIFVYTETGGWVNNGPLQGLPGKKARTAHPARRARRATWGKKAIKATRATPAHRGQRETRPPALPPPT